MRTLLALVTAIYSLGITTIPAVAQSCQGNSPQSMESCCPPSGMDGKSECPCEVKSTVPTQQDDQPALLPNDTLELKVPALLPTVVTATNVGPVLLHSAPSYQESRGPPFHFPKTPRALRAPPAQLR